MTTDLNNKKQKKINDFNKTLLGKQKKDIFHKIYYLIISFPWLYKYRQIVKYLSIGFFGTIIDYGVLLILTEVFGIFYLISACVSYFLGLISNFILNKKYTFKFENNKLNYLIKTFLSYFFVSVSSLIITLLFMSFFVEVLGIYYIISKIIISLIMLFYRYFAHSKCFKRNI
jgi:putative flippase GtrA